MSDVVDPDGVTAEWLTKIFAAEGVLGKRLSGQLCC
jgi:hypothetical protein